jgi:hypothetical protein
MPLEMSMNKHLIALATAALLAGCGGGADEAAPSAAPATPAAAASQLRTTLAAQPIRVNAVTPAQAADQLMNFAETTFPMYFPSHQATGTLDPFLFRYYPQTGVYLGVVVKANMGYTLNGVYVMGGPFGDAPLYVGQLTQFITPTDPGTGGPTGPNNGCYDLGLLEATGTRVDLTMLHNGDSTGTVNQVWTVNGPKTFEGVSAVETLIKMTGSLTSEGTTANVDSETKGYDKRTGDAEVTSYGMEMVIRTSLAGFDLTMTSKSVGNPPSVDRHYGLAAGQSVTQSSTTTVTSVTTGIPGVPPTPNTSTSTTTETIKFVGREQVTVPAKTFNACKFETTIAGVPNEVTTMWVIDGKGIPVKIQHTTNGVVTQTQQATVVKVNGQAL